MVVENSSIQTLTAVKHASIKILTAVVKMLPSKMTLVHHIRLRILFNCSLYLVEVTGFVYAQYDIHWACPWIRYFLLCTPAQSVLDGQERHADIGVPRPWGLKWMS